MGSCPVSPQDTKNGPVIFPCIHHHPVEAGDRPITSLRSQGMDPSSSQGSSNSPWIHRHPGEAGAGSIIPAQRQRMDPSSPHGGGDLAHPSQGMQVPRVTDFAPQGHQWLPSPVPTSWPLQQPLWTVLTVGNALRFHTETPGKWKNGGGGVAWGESSRRNSHGMVKSMVLNPHFSLFQWGWREDVTPCVIKPPISSHHTFGCSCSSWQHQCGAVLPSWATAAGAGWARWCCQLLCHTLGSVLSFPHLWKDTGGVCRRVLHLLNSSQPSPSFGLTQVIFSTFFISSLSVRC